MIEQSNIQKTELFPQKLSTQLCIPVFLTPELIQITTEEESFPIDEIYQKLNFLTMEVDQPQLTETFKYLGKDSTSCITFRFSEATKQRLVENPEMDTDETMRNYCNYLDSILEKKIQETDHLTNQEITDEILNLLRLGTLSPFLEQPHNLSIEIITPGSNSDYCSWTLTLKNFQFNQSEIIRCPGVDGTSYTVFKLSEHTKKSLSGNDNSKEMMIHDCIGLTESLEKMVYSDYVSTHQIICMNILNLFHLKTLPMTLEDSDNISFERNVLNEIWNIGSKEKDSLFEDLLSKGNDESLRNKLIGLKTELEKKISSNTPVTYQEGIQSIKDLYITRSLLILLKYEQSEKAISSIRDEIRDGDLDYDFILDLFEENAGSIISYDR